ncbi:MAG: galactitol-1-phosphate 5-dehydrogenase [Verrucomicrobiota bacterium]
MKAVVLHAVNDLRYEDVPVASLPAGHVRVRVGFCGVCGSDIPRIFSKGTYRFPTICGHEFAGTIGSVASDVTGFQPGDRVAVFPLLWCGKCPACAVGKYVQCADYDYFGSRRDGAFAEHLDVPIRNLLRIPAAVSLEEAAMTEPCAVARHALRRVSADFTGKSVVIFGAGPVGLMVALWARAMHAASVVITDPIPQKLDLARRLGLQTGAADVTADVTVDAAGAPPALLAALRAAKAGGAVVWLGNPSGDLALPAALWSQLMRREVTLYGTWNSDFNPTGTTDDWHAALAAMADKTLDLKPLITHRVPLADAIGALQMMKTGTEFYAKVLIHP